MELCQPLSCPILALTDSHRGQILLPGFLLVVELPLLRGCDTRRSEQVRTVLVRARWGPAARLVGAHESQTTRLVLQAGSAGLAVLPRRALPAAPGHAVGSGPRRPAIRRPGSARCSTGWIFSQATKASVMVTTSHTWNTRAGRRSESSVMDRSSRLTQIQGSGWRPRSGTSGILYGRPPAAQRGHGDF